MITSNKDFEGLNTNNKPETYFGLSTDEKPITAVNGSCFIEMDTSTMYFFDEEAKEWSIWSSSGGGGGGGGSSALSELTDVDLTNPTDGQTLVYNATSGKWENGAGGVFAVHDVDGTLDKTWQEIYDAFAAAKIVVIRVPANVDMAEIHLPTFAAFDDAEGYYYVSDSQDSFAYIAQTPSGYPIVD